jgi:ribosomal-protein-alanine N-acetyltransferase
MSRLELRPLDAAHLGIAAALHAACFPDDPWSESALGDILAMPNAFGRIAVAGEANPLGLVVGYVVGETAEIATLGVLSSARNRGVGRALVEAAAAVARATGAARLLLEVAADNGVAQALYARCGFYEIGRRRAYYRRPNGTCDAVALACDLASPNREEIPARL